jgi:very-short-patch-repair endonuclease
MLRIPQRNPLFVLQFFAKTPSFQSNFITMKTDPATKANYFLYNRGLKHRSRSLRNNSTKAEIKLWGMLKGRQMLGFTFNRQRPVLNYIGDFMCKDLLLIIEADGGIHALQKQIDYDKKRENDLIQGGFTILRFTNGEIIERPDEVFLEIKTWVENKMKTDGVVPSNFHRSRNKE